MGASGVPFRRAVSADHRRGRSGWSWRRTTVGRAEVSAPSRASSLGLARISTGHTARPHASTSTALLPAVVVAGVRRLHWLTDREPSADAEDARLRDFRP